MYVGVYGRCGGCVNEEPGQQSHDYCLLVYPATKAAIYFQCFFFFFYICGQSIMA